MGTFSHTGNDPGCFYDLCLTAFGRDKTTYSRTSLKSTTYICSVLSLSIARHLHCTCLFLTIARQAQKDECCLPHYLSLLKEHFFLLTVSHRSFTTLSSLCEARLKGYLQPFSLKNPSEFPIKGHIFFPDFPWKLSNAFYSSQRGSHFPFPLLEKHCCSSSQQGMCRREN